MGIIRERKTDKCIFTNEPRHEKNTDGNCQA